MARQPFIRSLPQEDWQLILGLVEGKKPTSNDAVHAVLDAESFVAGKIWPDGTPPPVVMTATENDGFDPKEFIRSQAEGKKTAGKVNWLKLLQLLLTLFGPLLQLASAAAKKA